LSRSTIPLLELDWKTLINHRVEKKSIAILRECHLKRGCYTVLQAQPWRLLETKPLQISTIKSWQMHIKNAEKRTLSIRMTIPITNMEKKDFIIGSTTYYVGSSSHGSTYPNPSPRTHWGLTWKRLFIIIDLIFENLTYLHISFKNVLLF